MTPAEREAERIRAEYQRRDREIGREFYSLTKDANLFTRQGQQRGLLDQLRRGHLLPLDDKRILEVGCGRGQWFGVFRDFGARYDQLAGIDLDAERVEEARAIYPTADLRVGDATQLPWPDASFDIVFQSTVFTSILDDAIQAAVAREMLRVLRQDGSILWYDFRYPSPNNPHVRPVGARRIRELFTGCEVAVTPVTLATPLARRIVPRSWMAATILERLRPLNTHYYALVRRQSLPW